MVRRLVSFLASSLIRTPFVRVHSTGAPPASPPIVTATATAPAHADTMAGALHDLANGDLPDIPPERAQQLVDNVVPDPAHEAMADLHEAAQAELPGFESAAADIKPVEMPPEGPAPWWSQLWSG